MSREMIILAGLVFVACLMWWVNNSVSLDVPSSLLLERGITAKAEILGCFHSSRGYFVRYRFFAVTKQAKEVYFQNTQQISRHFYDALSHRSYAQVMYLPSKPHVSALVPNLERNPKKGRADV